MSVRDPLIQHQVIDELKVVILTIRIWYIRRTIVANSV